MKGGEGRVEFYMLERCLEHGTTYSFGYNLKIPYKADNIGHMDKQYINDTDMLSGF